MHDQNPMALLACIIFS